MAQIIVGSNRPLAKTGCGCSPCSALLHLGFSGSRLSLLDCGTYPAEIMDELRGKTIIRAASTGDGIGWCGVERIIYNLDMTSS
jgi:hypothetical protein